MQNKQLKEIVKNKRVKNLALLVLDPWPMGIEMEHGVVFQIWPLFRKVSKNIVETRNMNGYQTICS